MRWIVTGLNGTVAPVLAQALRSRGDEVVAWDRSAVPVDDDAAVRAFVERVEPDGIAHLAMGSPDWAAAMAGLCRERDARFLFTGSVSVFAPEQRGPLSVAVTPSASDDYGRYKYECEQAIAAANPDAVIARIGWQIGEAPGSNTMTDYLTRHAAEGPVEASTRWVPSCSFLPDTAEALVGLADRREAGVYHLEGNPGLSLYDIATRLRVAMRASWEVVATESVDMDNRMVDPRVSVRPITDRL